MYQTCTSSSHICPSERHHYKKPSHAHKYKLHGSSHVIFNYHLSRASAKLRAIKSLNSLGLIPEDSSIQQNMVPRPGFEPGIFGSRGRYPCGLASSSSCRLTGLDDRGLARANGFDGKVQNVK